MREDREQGHQLRAVPDLKSLLKFVSYLKPAQPLCVCVCVRACACACVHVRAHVCVRVRAHVRV